jgi:hypothetical protein
MGLVGARPEQKRGRQIRPFASSQSGALPRAGNADEPGEPGQAHVAERSRDTPDPLVGLVRLLARQAAHEHWRLVQEGIDAVHSGWEQEAVASVEREGKHCK